MSKINKLPATILVLLLGGCGLFGKEQTPPEKEKTGLEIKIEADSDVNSDIKGRGAPVLLRIYELRSPISFQDADFFELQDHDKAVLGADLLAVDQFIVRPGESRAIKRTAQDSSTTIGVFVAYRDLPNATWRLVHTMTEAPNAHWYRALVSSKTTRLNIRLQQRAAMVTDLDAKPAPPPPRQALESASKLTPN